ncbi:hypothetical protein ACFQHN_32025 [Natrialbaceae archaeon GCM10025896]|uniref:hypothetical protein n=1 Tax=Halovenus amylolytica TaxID=2500550 RepID=UPI00361DBC1F
MNEASRSRQSRNFVTAGLSRPLVVIPSLIVFETTLDFERIPLALVVQEISERPKLPTVQLYPSLAPIGNEGGGSEFVKNLARSGVVTGLDGGYGEEILLDDRRSPTVLGYHRCEESIFH